MVNTNKVLTVSYGTFSCTLEGFEDSFDTMKAIAEYFRDLAAEDRYFGAEPPTPDADMLARIAEREIARRVDARMDHDRIVLRATAPATSTADMTAPLAAPVATQASALPPAALDSAAQPTIADTAAADMLEPTSPAPATPAPATPAQDSASVAAKLDRIRAVVARTPVLQADDITDEPAVASDLPDLATADAAQTTPDPLADTVDLADDLDAPAPVEAAALAEPAPDVVAADPVPETVPEVAPEAMADDLAAETDPVAVSDAATSDAAAPAATAEAATPDDDLDSILARLMSKTARRSDLLPTPPKPATDAASAASLAVQQAITPQDMAVGLEQAAAPADAAPGAAVPPLRARVMKMKRADFQAALARGLIADQPAPTPEADQPASGLSPEDEADLARELAEVEADLDQRPAMSRTVAPDDLDDDGDDDLLAETAEDWADEDDGDLVGDDLEDDDEADDHVAEDDNAAADDLENLPAADPDRAAGQGAARRGASLFTDDDGDDSDDIAAAIARAAARRAATAPRVLPAPQDSRAVPPVAPVTRTIPEDAAIPDPQAPAPRGDVMRGDTARSDMPRDAGQRLSDATADRDVMRLMAKTMSEMDEPESTHRRSAIAHLRAAVAATKAEKSQGGLKPLMSSDPYRDDLASVVRPRRPVTDGSATTRRASDPRPAPLKLVAEQRVDLPVAAGAQPGMIRPRRISVADLGGALRRAGDAADPERVLPQKVLEALADRMDDRAALSDTAALQADETDRDLNHDTAHDTAYDLAQADFADFAEQVGARSLSDVLEAAASYLAFVEGQDAFSRPQLMTKVRQLSGEDYSREDGLRSFGILLRSGKIEKLKGGRFTVSDRIGFRPDARAAS